MKLAQTFRWGIIGAGKIAEKFAEAIPLSGNAVLWAIASRDAGNAQRFAEKYRAEKWYDSYDTLASDPDIAAVYVATPHGLHAEHAILCLKNGKGVLCEKPLAINAKQVFDMVSASRKYKSFLMEAMWSRFLPVTESLLDMVKSGMIGEVKHVRADFGFKADYRPDHRLFNLSLGGGALLDVGVYPLFLCQLLLGKPEKIIASAVMAETGADTSTQALLQYKSGATAHIYGGFTADTSCTAEIVGAKGRILIPTAWYKSDRLVLETASGLTQEFTYLKVVNGFEYEIKEAMHCIRAGVIESPFYTHTFSYDLAETMDAIRKLTGVIYPADQLST